MDIRFNTQIIHLKPQRDLNFFVESIWILINEKEKPK